MRPCLRVDTDLGAMFLAVLVAFAMVMMAGSLIGPDGERTCRGAPGRASNTAQWIRCWARAGVVKAPAALTYDS